MGDLYGRKACSINWRKTMPVTSDETGRTP